uniref:Cellulase n=1 Tax=Romanomermis culicivorax TaxID=13658 RepID=A0A915KBC4_ROMCU
MFAPLVVHFIDLHGDFPMRLAINRIIENSTTSGIEKASPATLTSSSRHTTQKLTTVISADRGCKIQECIPQQNIIENDSLISSKTALAETLAAASIIFKMKEAHKDKVSFHANTKKEN